MIKLNVNISAFVLTSHDRDRRMMIYVLYELGIIIYIIRRKCSAIVTATNESRVDAHDYEKIQQLHSQSFSTNTF